MPASILIQGGLGNQLFQIATCYSFAIKNGLDYCIPTEVVNPHYPLSPEQQSYRFPGIKYCYEPIKGTRCVHVEQQFHYKEIPNKECDNIELRGYYQSYRYFDEYRSGILKAFGFDDIKTLFPDTASLHYRCGDYKRYSNHHPVITSEYIINAISKMQERGYTKFLVFSDEMPEIRRILDEIGYPKDMFEYSVSADPLYELRLMASCGANVISNSTFSWWASYINPNPNKIIIAPRNWFGPASAQNDTKDLYLPGTTIL